MVEIPLPNTPKSAKTQKLTNPKKAFFTPIYRRQTKNRFTFNFSVLRKSEIFAKM